MTIRPHYINALCRSNGLDFHYDETPYFDEQEAREMALEGYGCGFQYLHTVHMRPGAHGQLVAEIVTFTERPAQMPDWHTPSWAGSCKEG